MKTTWQLQEAKNRLSELVEQAMTTGAQVITKHGHPAVVVVSAAVYAELTQAKPREKMEDILQSCPVPGYSVEKTRGKARRVDLD